MNKFIEMRTIVEQEVNRYDRIKEQFGISDSWHSESIHRLANPFLKGFFTLAIVGKMSSGKSTFINALIGDNILPTGHFQTTSAITYIQNGPNPLMRVKYCDGHTEVITKDIAKRLLELVAVPEEFSDLPINDINILIEGGDSVSDILRKKEGIEERTKMSPVDEKIWERYIKQYPRNKIAKEVYIEYPLSKEFEGWRIVDTPGVGAIGGIQDKTKQLLFESDDETNKKVDAIVFLHSGADNIEDESANDFVHNVSKSMPEDVKKRIFIVLTKAAKNDFRQYKDSIIDKAQKLFAQTFGIDYDRVTYVDSLLYRFCQDLTDKVGFGEKDPLEGWSAQDFSAMAELYTPVIRELKSRGLEITNESIEVILKEWANFDELKKSINTFVEKEKGITCEKIKKLIEGDFKGFIETFQKQVRLLKGGKSEIEEEKKNVSLKRAEYNNILNHFQRKASKETIWPQFAFIDDRIEGLSKQQSIDLIRTDYLNLINEATTKEGQIFEEVEREFYEFCQDFSADDIVLQSIDFASLERKAERESTKIVKDKSRPKKELEKKGGWTSPDKYKTVYPHTKNVIDFEEKRRNFAAYVIQEARKAKETFREQLINKIETLHSLVKKELDQKLESVKQQLEELESKIANKDNEIEKLTNNIKQLKDYETK